MFWLAALTDSDVCSIDAKRGSRNEGNTFAFPSGDAGRAPSVCLGNENFYRLVSLWKIMEYYNIWSLVGAFDLIREIEQEYRERSANVIGEVTLPDDQVKRLQNLMKYCERSFSRAHLSAAVARINGPIRVALATEVTVSTMLTELRVLRESIEPDLQLRCFVYVPPEKAAPWYGIEAKWKRIWDKIPACRFDSEEAVYCYALGRNTACAFHCMRVAEHGMRFLFRAVRASLRDKGKRQRVESAEWSKIIAAIQNRVHDKLTAASQLPASSRKSARIAFYSDAADHCLYLKELRNEVSHARKPYNAGEALGILERVWSFMAFLSSRSPNMQS